MAMLLGTALGVAMYAAAPWLLARIAGPASAEVVAPALVYVRIRCAHRPLSPAQTEQRSYRLVHQIITPSNAIEVMHKGDLRQYNCPE